MIGFICLIAILATQFCIASHIHKSEGRIMAAIDNLKDAVASLQAQETLVKEFIISLLKKVDDLQKALDAQNEDVTPVIQEQVDLINTEIQDFKDDISQVQAKAKK